MAPTHYSVAIDDGPQITLPVREIKPGLSLAIFNLLGDWDLTERVGKVVADMLRVVPADAILCPDGKAQALGHVVGRELGLPVVFARKELKSYMVRGPRVPASSITSGKHSWWLDAEESVLLHCRKVIILDDVVSGGGTLAAMRGLLKLVHAEEAKAAAVFCEGESRLDVWHLGNLPVWGAPSRPITEDQVLSGPGGRVVILPPSKGSFETDVEHDCRMLGHREMSGHNACIHCDAKLF